MSEVPQPEPQEQAKTEAKAESNPARTEAGEKLASSLISNRGRQINEKLQGKNGEERASYLKANPSANEIFLQWSLRDGNAENHFTQSQEETGPPSPIPFAKAIEFTTDTG